MKKVLVVLTLTMVSLVSNAQTDTTGFRNKILDLFKSEVVNTTFKDPYSFQLLSLEYNPVTKGRTLEVSIMTDSLYQTYSWASKKEKKEHLEKMNKNIEELNKLTDVDKNNVQYFIVSLECRGANSYGNLVYDKYLARYYPSTNSVDNFVSLKK